MGSLSKFFADHNDLLAEAFDLDEETNLVERDHISAAAVENLVHKLLVNEMQELLTELIVPAPRDERKYQRLPPTQASNPEQGQWHELPAAAVAQRRADTGEGPPVRGQPGQGQPSRGQPGQGQPTGGGAPGVPYRGAIDPTTSYGNTPTGSAGLVQGLYSAARKNGFSDAGARHLVAEINRENSFNPNLIFGTHTDPKNAATNGGVISWQGDRRNNLMNYLGQNGALDQNGGMLRNQANLDAQMAFMAQEMKQSHPQAYQYFSDPSVKFDKEQGTNMMGGKGGYIAWALHNPTYRSGGLANIEKGYNIVNQSVPADTGNASGQFHPGGTLTPNGYYGATRNPYTGSSGAVAGHLHAGHDLGGAPGDPVRATQGGTVLPSSGYHNGYGQTVDILFPDGRFERHAHLENPTVRPGDKVAPGHTVGSIGSEKHNHYELHTHYDSQNPGNNYGRNTTVDPTEYLQSLNTPTAVAQNQQPQKPVAAQATQGGGKPNYLAIGDSLAHGVGQTLGDYRYGVSSSNPEKVNGLVQQAIKNGDVTGKHIVLSGGASNAGGDVNSVNTYYPQMIKSLKDAGASNVTVMGVGPYQNYNKYGYNDAIGKIAQNTGANFTGPLANIAPFRGSDVQAQVHPADYKPIMAHINNTFLPTQMAQKPPAPEPVKPATQVALNTPKMAAPQIPDGNALPPVVTPPKPVASGQPVPVTPPPTPPPPPKQVATAAPPIPDGNALPPVVTAPPKQMAAVQPAPVTPSPAAAALPPDGNALPPVVTPAVKTPLVSWAEPPKRRRLGISLLRS